MCIYTPIIRIAFIGLPQICAIFAVLTDNLMLTNYFSNNLYGLPYDAHTPASMWHTPDALLRYHLQFLNQGFDKGLYILLIMRPLSNASRKNVPGLRSGNMASQFITLIYLSSRKVVYT